MTGNILAFENAEFGIIRTQNIDGNLWFVGKDVANALGYSNPRKALIDHVDEEDKGVTKCDTLGAEIIREDSISVGEYATFLRQNGVNIGRNRLFAYFFENGYMTRGSRSEEHFPTKKSMDLGLFEMSGRTIKVSLLGRKYFNEIFLTNTEQSSCCFTRRIKP